LLNVAIVILMGAMSAAPAAFAEPGSKQTLQSPISIEITAHQNDADASESQRHHGRSGQDHGGAIYDLVYAGEPQPADIKSKWDEWREKQDLEAQQDMAWSARISWLVALIGVGITLLGVIYVRQTLVATVGMLDEARKTTEISQKQLIASQRPWLKIEPSLVGNFDSNDTEITLRVLVKVRNIGNHPARNIGVSPRLTILTAVSWKVGAFPLIEELQTSMGRAGLFVNKDMGGFLLPGDDYSDEFQVLIRHEKIREAATYLPNIPLHLICCVRYTSDLTMAEHRSGILREIRVSDTAAVGGLRAPRHSDVGVAVDRFSLHKLRTVTDYAT
jgi:hypothetical protein